MAAKHQIIANGTNMVRSYDVSSGELIWETSGMTVNVIPMPVHLDGLVLVTSGFRGNALLAINLDAAKGDITDSDAIVWKLDKDTPYAPSPLLYDDIIYFLKTNTAILSSFNAKTGEENYRQQRLEDMGTVYSSPVGAAGRVYITDRDGNTTVIRHGSTVRGAGQELSRRWFRRFHGGRRRPDLHAGAKQSLLHSARSVVRSARARMLTGLTVELHCGQAIAVVDGELHVAVALA